MGWDDAADERAVQEAGGEVKSGFRETGEDVEGEASVACFAGGGADCFEEFVCMG